MDGGLILAGVAALAVAAAVGFGIRARLNPGARRASIVGAVVAGGVGTVAVAVIAVLSMAWNACACSRLLDPEQFRGLASAELASSMLFCDRGASAHGDPAAIDSWWTLTAEPESLATPGAPPDPRSPYRVTVTPYGDPSAAPVTLDVDDPAGAASITLPLSMATRHIALTAPGTDGRRTVVLGTADIVWKAEIFTGMCADADLAYVKNTLGIPMQRLTDAQIRAWPTLAATARSALYTPIPATPRAITERSVETYPISLGGAPRTERFAAVMTAVTRVGPAPETDTIYVVTPEGVAEGMSFRNLGPGAPVDVQGMAIPGDSFGIVLQRDGRYYLLAAPPAPVDLLPGHTYGTTVTLNYDDPATVTSLDGAATASVPEASVGPFARGGRAEGYAP